MFLLNYETVAWQIKIWKAATVEIINGKLFVYFALYRILYLLSSEKHPKKSLDT